MIFIENHENHTIVIFQWTNHTSKLLHWSKLTTIYSYYATLCKLLKSYIQRSKYYWDHVHENMTVIMACIAAAFFCGNTAWGHRTCGIGLFHSTFGNDGWESPARTTGCPAYQAWQPCPCHIVKMEIAPYSTNSWSAGHFKMYTWQSFSRLSRV